MLQRIQSIWLLLASALAFATLQFPFYMGTDATGIPGSSLEAKDSMVLLLPTIAIGVMTLLTIFLFKNRGLQVKFIAAALILEAFLLFLYYRETQTYTGGQFVLTSILHVFILIFFFFSIRGVRKDEKIIKESNRIR